MILDGAAHQTSVIQGRYAIGTRSGDVLVTILGSCVATCLFDPVAGVGGLNHFLLPDGHRDDPNSAKYGLNLMELLINALLKAGARRDRLQGKLFGGARMLAGITSIGDLNADFARRFLAEEGIPCLSASLGGEQARKLRFWPRDGRAQQLLLPRDAELPPPPTPAPLPGTIGRVDLF